MSLVVEQIIPKGYKQTEVGVIPDDWGVQALECLINFRNGTAHEDCIDEFGDYFVVNSKFISTEGKVKKGSKECRQPAFKNDLLMVMSDIPNGKAIAKCFLVEEDEKYTINQQICALKPTSVDSKYLFYTLNRNSFYLAFDDGAKQTNLRRQDVLNCPVRVPSPEEQTAIANALSDVDALLSELEKLIAKKQAIKTTVMQQLLTGKTRLPVFIKHKNGKVIDQVEESKKSNQLDNTPNEWKLVTLGQDATLKARIGWQALTTKEYLEFGPRLLVTGTDFNAGIVDWNSCCYVSDWRYKQDHNIQLREGDVLVTKDGTIGKVGYVSKLPLEATLNSGVFVIRPKNKKFVPKFLFYILNSSIFTDFIRAITAGSTITHLYQRDFVNFGFYAPNQEEQTAIVTILSDMDNEIQTLEQRLAKTRQIKQGMMQELLTGKTRLPFEKGDTTSKGVCDAN